MDTDRVLAEDIIPFLPLSWGEAVCDADKRQQDRLTELRLRAGQRICLRYGREEVSVDGIVVTVQELDSIVSALCHHSRYAIESELKNGYITIRGGHRIGLAGQAVLADGKIKLLKEIGSMTIRIAREVIGSAQKLVPYVRDGERILSTLIVAPPYSGKTTILRDLIRILSDGDMHHRGVQVAVADERSEIAGMYLGQAMLDVGSRTDVIDGAPKAESMMLLIRAMSPEVIATDELGRKEDFAAVEEAVRAGVAVIATLHGRSRQDVMYRMGKQMDGVLAVFERIVFLADRPTMGAIRAVMSREEVSSR